MREICSYYSNSKGNSLIDDAGSFFEKMNKLKNYEMREGQVQLAYDITKSIMNKKCMLGEAGVGIGKSFAYIIPLLFYNKRTKKPVIIATSTIALQDQIVNDISSIAELMEYYPEIVNSKGQNHFVCRKRAEEYENYSNAGLTTLAAIREGAGERKDFSFCIGDDLWSCINVNRYNSVRCSNCEYCSDCKYHKLRNRMRMTDGVIVCNQDLLLVNQDRSLDYEKSILNPNANVIVIDEAHNLENKMRNLLTVSLIIRSWMFRYRK